MERFFLVKYESLNDTSQFNCNLSNKLKVSNFSRPDKSQIKRNTESYIHVVRSKFRNLKRQVVHMHKFKKNLNKKLQNALQKLRDKTKNRGIVIVNSNKDGKITVLNYKDVISLKTKLKMKTMRKWEKYNEKVILVKMTKLKENFCHILIDMWKKDYSDDNLYF